VAQGPERKKGREGKERRKEGGREKGRKEGKTPRIKFLPLLTEVRQYI
jgi:hypothetical protein